MADRRPSRSLRQPGPNRPAANTIVRVSSLYSKDAMIEIEAIAVGTTPSIRPAPEEDSLPAAGSCVHDARENGLVQPAWRCPHEDHGGLVRPAWHDADTSGVQGAD